MEFLNAAVISGDALAILPSPIAWTRIMPPAISHSGRGGPDAVFSVSPPFVAIQLAPTTHPPLSGMKIRLFEKISRLD